MTHRQRRRIRPLGVLAVCSLALPAVSSAAEDSGISVVGVGKVEARPSIVELAGTITGEAELAGDAVTKYHSNRQAAIESLEALQIAGLSVDGGGITVNSSMTQNQIQAMQRGMAITGETGKLSIAEPLKIRIEGVDQMETEQVLEMIVKIVDAGKDAGVLIGPQINYNPYYGYQGQNKSSLASFKLAKVEDLKAQAYEKAIADARTQAGRLATLAGVKLGQVTSIREGALTSSRQQQVIYAYPGMNTQQEEDQYSTSELKDVTVRIILQVDFAIE